MTRTKVAALATHPIQYQVPWFRALAQRPEIDLKVYFALLPDSIQQGIGFGVAFQWDIPMLEGYPWERLENARARPALGTFFGSSTPGIGDVLRRDAPDAAIITGWNALPLLQGLLACRRLGIPTIVRGESNAMRARRPWVRLGHRALLARYDAFLAIGEANRRFYAANGIPESRMFASRYFVDNARFADQADALRGERAALRERWGIAPDAVCFLFAGKLEPKKRPLDIVAALAAMRRRERAHLLIAGHGEQASQVRAAADAGSLPVTMAGFLNQSEMPRAYAAADCLVLPSDYGETWGLVVNEAMASGLPAVVSDRVGCGPDLVEGHGTGRVFPFGDVQALASTLDALAGDPAALASMGEKARTHVAAYSVRAAVDGTLRAVQYVTRKKQGA